MIRVNHARRSRKQDNRQNILLNIKFLYFLIFEKTSFFFENFEANFEKCYHQYSKRYVIRKKSDDTCVNPKIKHRIHQGMWQVL